MVARKPLVSSGMPSIAIVLGYLAVRELGSDDGAVRILYRLGYGIKEIATICGFKKTAGEKILNRYPYGVQGKAASGWSGSG